jgi:transcriptional regulator with XRE-family HTH domain
MNFGERLRMARERKGLSQLDVYNKTNISNKSLSRYENNKTSPDPEVIKTLIKLYDVSADFIFGFSNEMGQTFSSKQQKRQPKLSPSKNQPKLSLVDAKILKNFETLSPESKEKADDYLEMLNTLQQVKNNSNTVDFKEKA